MLAQIVTIDGPPASGKTTMASLLAKELNFIHLDSGAVFRTITLYCMQKNVDFSDSKNVIKVLNDLGGLAITCDNKHNTYLFDQNISKEIRTPAVTNNVKFVSYIPEVRTFVKNHNIQLSNTHKVVAEGRKVGTEVFPNADVKFYLKASLEARTMRRFLQQKNSGCPTCYKNVFHELKDREEYEVESGILLMPDNPIIIDNTNLSIWETLSLMKTYLQ